MPDNDLTGNVTVHHPTDPALMADVLQVYKPQCRYLKSADTMIVDDRLTVRGEFAIPEPYYIEDTGHFNAVEFVICFNQMMYYAVAKAVKEGMIDPFRTWELEDFWKRQLTDFLITTQHSRFRKAMSSRRFHGEGTFVRLIERNPSGRRPLLLIDTVCRFWDDEGGRCDGQIKAALVYPPVTNADATKETA